MADDRYQSDALDAQIDPESTYDTYKGKFTKIDTKAKTPTYKHAQKEAMQKGDSGTYFMRKSGGKKKARKGGSK
jgi:hypothetical protein